MMDLFSLKGKTAWIVGGTKGLGKGISKALCSAGAVVVVTSRKPVDCENAAAEISAESGGVAYGIPGDIGTPESVKEVFARVLDKVGQVDILVNSAGVNIRKPSLEYTEQDWDTVQNTQLKGVFFTTQAVAQQMVDKKIQGRIINMSSINAQVIARPNIISYVAAKGAVKQLTKALAVEWAPYGITVNAIAPGWYITEMTKAVFDDPATKAEILQHVPMKRLGTPEDLGGIAVYYASEAGRYTTGQLVFIDGGYTCI